MKKQHLYILLTALLTCAMSSLFAQSEQLSPLGANVRIQQHRALLGFAKTAAAPDTIDIPVIDDFSSTEVFPDPAFWTDEQVYINNTYSRNPISLGVATFDGLDANGYAYVNNNAAATGRCDELTSHPIRLLTRPGSLGGGQFSLADSLTLSFYYQKKGWGDSPESSDSLVVEYYNPTNNKWSRQWYATGPVAAGQDTAFTRVQITLRDTAFLKDGFRFRFHTWGSQTGMQDIWHVDYVRLFRGVNSFGQLDTNIIDVAVTEPATSFLKEYTSLPWEHFVSLSQAARDNMTKTSSTLTYRIHDVTTGSVGFNERIYDWAGNYVAGDGATGGNIFSPLPFNKFLTYNFNVDSVFPINNPQTPDSTFFTIKNYFSNGSGFQGLSSNDTTSYKQEFYNYYSYDDGTAEAGYDLISAPNGKLAMRFDILKADTLRAVRFAFVKQLLDVSNKLFTLKVWSSLSPETVIYQDFNNRPAFVDSVNGFATYVLDQIVPVSGTIYVGFQQVAADGLHLGFDRNTNSLSKMFYNLNGTWNNVSVANGSFMIRPVMGDTNLFVGVGEQQAEMQVQLYPNPVSNTMHVLAGRDFQSGIMELLDASGRVLIQDVFREQMEVGHLQAGIYFLRLTNAKQESLIRRFVKSTN